jgi:hypothetical protein
VLVAVLTSAAQTYRPGSTLVRGLDLRSGLQPGPLASSVFSSTARPVGDTVLSRLALPGSECRRGTVTKEA